MKAAGQGMGLVCLLVVTVSAFATDDSSRAPPVELPAAQSADEQAVLLTKAVQELLAGRRQQVVEVADQVIAHFKTTYADEKRVLYSAGDAAEAIAYLAKAANEHRDALVVSYTWGYAYLLKGYALVELGRLDEARRALDAAVALSPLNPNFLSERGYLHQLESQSAEALESYRLAEDGARAAPPGETQKRQLSVALRGQGYALIELGRLDEAEGIYRKCFEIDANDAKARNEMLYIESLRKKQRGGGPHKSTATYAKNRRGAL